MAKWGGLRMSSSLRRARRLAVLLACAVLPCASPMAAPANKQAARLDVPAPATAARCQGDDLLAEMRVKEPETHRSIMEQAAATENSGALLWRLERPGRPPSHL